MVHWAFNVFDYDSIRGLFNAASKFDTWVYLQTSKSTVKHYGFKTIVNLINNAAKGFNKNLCKLHLDHCDDFSIIEGCIDHGWYSVMYDGSNLTLDENIKHTVDVVSNAHSKNVLVEAELGKIGGEEDGFGTMNAEENLIDINHVLRFVQETSVDLLAIGIGNKHGFYKKDKDILNLSLLKKVHEIVPSIELVLHGGTGIPKEELEFAVANGVSKINISTEVKQVYLKAMQDHLVNNKKFDMIKMIEQRVFAVEQLVRNKLLLFNAEKQ